MAVATSPSLRASNVVNGDRRSFALLRPITDTHAQERVRDLVLRPTPSMRRAPRKQLRS